MTRAGIIKAAEETLALAEQHAMNHRVPRNPALDYPHLAEMLEQMREPEFSIGKLNRWLGWIQAAVCGGVQVITLEDVKQINLRNRDVPDEQPCGGAWCVGCPKCMGY